MNRFNMLTQLREDIKNAKDTGFDAKGFVLSGVVVHDVNDNDLISCMRRNFVKWAEMTGDHFLFITFVHPSTEWKNSKYCRDAYGVDSYKLLTDSTFSKEDEEKTMPLLRDFMDLPQSGSYLMLTDNLTSNSFYKIPICAETIEDQFLLITHYCDEESSGINHSPSDFNKLLATLNAGEFSIMNSLLDVLIDFTSLTTSPAINRMGMPFSDFYPRKQLLQVREVIRKLRAKMRDYRGDDFEDRLFNFFECMEVVFTRHFNINRGLHDPVMGENRYMDEYSVKLYKTYRLLSPILENRGEDLDYSGLTIYLGKIVENELHLSVGQMLRWAMGIDMPEYFNKYCQQRKRVMVSTGNNQVDLNQPKKPVGLNSRQKGISMGTLLSAYENMYYRPQETTPEPDLEKMQELDGQLLFFLKGFCDKYRNPAGHIDGNSEFTYRGAKVAFEEFVDRYLVKLYNIRQSIINLQPDNGD